MTSKKQQIDRMEISQIWAERIIFGYVIVLLILIIVYMPKC